MITSVFSQFVSWFTGPALPKNVRVEPELIEASGEVANFTDTWARHAEVAPTVQKAWESLRASLGAKGSEVKVARVLNRTLCGHPVLGCGPTENWLDIILEYQGELYQFFCRDGEMNLWSEYAFKRLLEHFPEVAGSDYEPFRLQLEPHGDKLLWKLEFVKQNPNEEDNESLHHFWVDLKEGNVCHWEMGKVEGQWESLFREAPPLSDLLAHETVRSWLREEVAIDVEKWKESDLQENLSVMDHCPAAIPDWSKPEEGSSWRFQTQPARVTELQVAQGPAMLIYQPESGGPVTCARV